MRFIIFTVPGIHELKQALHCDAKKAAYTEAHNEYVLDFHDNGPLQAFLGQPIRRL
jgi:hypothetical protein